jgi:hypothetical protein
VPTEEVGPERDVEPPVKYVPTATQYLVEAHDTEPKASGTGRKLFTTRQEVGWAVAE